MSTIVRYKGKTQKFVFNRYTFPTALMGTACRHELFTSIWGGRDFGTYLSNSGTQKGGAS